MAEESLARGFQVGGERGDLFQSTASYYRRFRRSCPEAVVARLVELCQLDGTGRLLDVGCGTGQVFLALACHVAGVLAIDADADMVHGARQEASERGLSQVEVLQMRGEEIDASLGTFRVATFGSSFHWMDRRKVADLVFERLEPGGRLVVLGPGGLHSGVTAWEAEVRSTLVDFLGPERRAGGGVFRQGERHEQALARSRFRTIEQEKVRVHESWTIDQIVGYLFSTSYASRAVLGPAATAFEETIRNRLERLDPAGCFVKDAEYSILSAQRERETE